MLPISQEQCLSPVQWLRTEGKQAALQLIFFNEALIRAESNLKTELSSLTSAFCVSVDLSTTYIRWSDFVTEIRPTTPWPLQTED